MSIPRRQCPVNRALPPWPGVDPLDCPECHDARVWCLDLAATGYAAVCPSCAAEELPDEAPDDADARE